MRALTSQKGLYSTPTFKSFFFPDVKYHLTLTRSGNLCDFQFILLGGNFESDVIVEISGTSNNIQIFKKSNGTCCFSITNIWDAEKHFFVNDISF